MSSNSKAYKVWSCTGDSSKFKLQLPFVTSAPLFSWSNNAFTAVADGAAGCGGGAEPAGGGGGATGAGGGGGAPPAELPESAVAGDP